MSDSIGSIYELWSSKTLSRFCQVCATNRTYWWKNTFQYFLSITEKRQCLQNQRKLFYSVVYFFITLIVSESLYLCRHHRRHRDMTIYLTCYIMYDLSNRRGFPGLPLAQWPPGRSNYSRASSTARKRRSTCINHDSWTETYVNVNQSTIPLRPADFCLRLIRHGLSSHLRWNRLCWRKYVAPTRKEKKMIHIMHRDKADSNIYILFYTYPYQSVDLLHRSEKLDFMFHVSFILWIKCKVQFYKGRNTTERWMSGSYSRVVECRDRPHDFRHVSKRKKGPLTSWLYVPQRTRRVF